MDSDALNRRADATDRAARQAAEQATATQRVEREHWHQLEAELAPLFQQLAAAARDAGVPFRARRERVVTEHTYRSGFRRRTFTTEDSELVERESSYELLLWPELRPWPPRYVEIHPDRPPQYFTKETAEFGKAPGKERPRPVRDVESSTSLERLTPRARKLGVPAVNHFGTPTTGGYIEESYTHEERVALAREGVEKAVVAFMHRHKLRL